LKDLAKNFEKHCNVIQAAGRPLERNIAAEKATRQKPGQDIETVVLGEQMAHFKRVKEEKYKKLSELWEEYEEIEAQLMQSAISILGQDNVRITVQKLSEEQDNNTKQDQTKARSSTLKIKEACDQHVDFEKEYEDGLTNLDDIQDELNSLTSLTLKENKAVVQVRHTRRCFGTCRLIRIDSRSSRGVGRW